MVRRVGGESQLGERQKNAHLLWLAAEGGISGTGTRVFANRRLATNGPCARDSVQSFPPRSPDQGKQEAGAGGSVNVGLVGGFDRPPKVGTHSGSVNAIPMYRDCVSTGRHRGGHGGVRQLRVSRPGALGLGTAHRHKRCHRLARLPARLPRLLAWGCDRRTSIPHLPPWRAAKCNHPCHHYLHR